MQGNREGSAGVLPGKTAGQGLGGTGPGVPERHSDTEEVTGSNPVRPTRHFLLLAPPGSALWPYNCPTASATVHRKRSPVSGPPTCAQIAGRRAFSPDRCLHGLGDRAIAGVPRVMPGRVVLAVGEVRGQLGPRFSGCPHPAYDYSALLFYTPKSDTSSTASVGGPNCIPDRTFCAFVKSVGRRPATPNAPCSQGVHGWVRAVQGRLPG